MPVEGVDADVGAEAAEERAADTAPDVGDGVAAEGEKVWTAEAWEADDVAGGIDVGMLLW